MSGILSISVLKYAVRQQHCLLMTQNNLLTSKSKAGQDCISIEQFIKHLAIYWFTLVLRIVLNSTGSLTNFRMKYVHMLILVFFVDTVYSYIGSHFFLYETKISLVSSEIYFTEPHVVDGRPLEDITQSFLLLIIL